MGTETSQPDVEESTDSSSSSSLHEEPPELLPPPLNRFSVEYAGKPQSPEGEKPASAAVSASHAVPVPSTVTASESEWKDNYQFAHTLAAEDISRILDVDLQ